MFIWPSECCLRGSLHYQLALTGTSWLLQKYSKQIPHKLRNPPDFFWIQNWHFWDAKSFAKVCLAVAKVAGPLIIERLSNCRNPFTQSEFLRIFASEYSGPTKATLPFAQPSNYRSFVEQKDAQFHLIKISFESNCLKRPSYCKATAA